MARDTFFIASDAEDEITRLDRPPKEVIWTTPQGLKIPVVLPPTVYPPREDTNLLAKCIDNLATPNGKSLLEIGCGSGVISVFAAQRGFTVSACDINPYAVAATRKSAENINLDVEVREGGPGPSDDGEVRQWAGKEAHDFIVWNLPYISPNGKEKYLGPMEEAALLDTDAEGLIHRLLTQVSKHDLLTSTGVIFLVISSEGVGSNGRRICLRHGFASRIVDTMRFENGEKLDVLAAWKPYANMKKIHLEKVESTNSSLLNSDEAVGTLLTASDQTNGHGRRGRQWVHGSKAFAGSWVVQQGRLKAEPGVLQLQAGMALLEAIQAVTDFPEKVLLKWPNDVMIQSDYKTAKVGGVLIEGKSQGKSNRFVVGIGCNITKENLEGRDFESSAIEELSLECKVQNFTRVLHASVASWFEDKDHVEHRKKGTILEAFQRNITLTENASKGLFYRDKNYTFSGISTSGNLILTREGNQLLVLDDGEDVDWKF